MRVRRAVEADIPQLLDLMRRLAEFEGYAVHFAVDEETLREQGFRRRPADFQALVVDDNEDRLAGMLVFYFIAFTFRARPTLVVKELYVRESARGRRVGEALMRAAAATAFETGCGAVKWQVANWNRDGRRFYERLGATADEVWVDYGVSGAALAALAKGGAA